MLCTAAVLIWILLCLPQLVMPLPLHPPAMPCRGLALCPASPFLHGILIHPRPRLLLAYCDRWMNFVVFLSAAVYTSDALVVPPSLLLVILVRPGA